MHRRELTYLEQGQLIKRREELLEAMGLRAKDGRPKNPTPNDGFLESAKTTKDLAAELGFKETAVRDRKRVATNITTEVQEMIRETPLADRAIVPLWNPISKENCHQSSLGITVSFAPQFRGAKTRTAQFCAEGRIPLSRLV